MAFQISFAAVGFEGIRNYLGKMLIKRKMYVLTI